MDKSLLPLRYHCYWVCIIILEKAIKRFLVCLHEFISHTLLFILHRAPAAFNTAHFYLLVRLKETIVQGYFWKWKTATVFTVFTWTLHKPAGSTALYFWFIISSVGGCETIQEVWIRERMKTTKIFCFYLVHCLSGLHDRWSGHLQVHLFTDPVLLPPKMNYTLCLSVFCILLPKGRKQLIEWSENTNIIHHLLNTSQSGYSSIKKLR